VLLTLQAPPYEGGNPTGGNNSGNGVIRVTTTVTES
jgi:hypothetical protein